MHRNIGTFDQILRLVVGFILIGLSASNIIGMWGYLGSILVLTAVFNFCPLYAMLGTNSCSVR